MFFASVLLMACTWSGDGPMEATDGDLSGWGFYLAGELDSGRRVHAAGDTLLVELDSLWLVSVCYLDSVGVRVGTVDSALTLEFVLHLSYDPDANCAASDLATDSLFRLLPDSSWLSMDRMLLYGAEADQAMDTLSDSLGHSLASLDSAGRYGALLDTIWLRDGTNEDTTFYIELDSNFTDYHLFPLVNGDSPWVVRYLHSYTAGSDYWRYYTQTCAEPRTTCTLVSDTSWPDDYIFEDTTDAYLRWICEGDTTGTEYCLTKNWETDTSVAETYGATPDTVWTWSTYFVESTPSCAFLNREKIKSYSSSTSGGKVKFWRELFIPSANEERCGPPQLGFSARGSALEEWNLYDLDDSILVVDTALADSILEAIGFR
ncbi:MAG TPA: hypothetical protein VLM37_00515 [Fibrobacteraceae bacterium]|nr:hypothetical protein [Fibrobacteraceae bacterium]